MKDKLNITIRIANLTPMALQINREDEPVIRTAEYNVNTLFKEWSQRFAGKSRVEVLAMVAFQFAKAFVTLNNANESADRLLADFESQLDRLLTDNRPETPSVS